MEEFQEQYPWNEVSLLLGHPFRRKWDYYMTSSYNDDYIDSRLSIPANMTVAIDAYHDYDPLKFPNGQVLTLEQLQQKRILEGLINDARIGIDQSELTQEDKDRHNVEFVGCTVDGVLHTFILTHKQIKAGEQLFIYYGPNYG